MTLMFGVSYESVPLKKTLNDALFLTSVPPPPMNRLRFCSGPRSGTERAAPGQAIAAEPRAEVHAHRSESRLRDDLDVDAAGGVMLGRELIARDADRSNLRFVRQRAAFEAVDLDDRAGTGHVHQLLPQHVGIVRQRFELFAGERGAERGAARVGGRRLFVLADGDRFLVTRDRQHQHLLVGAVADAHVGQPPRFEAVELGLNRIAAGSEAGDRWPRRPCRLSPVRSSPPCSWLRCR